MPGTHERMIWPYDQSVLGGDEKLELFTSGKRGIARCIDQNAFYKRT